LVQLDRSLVFPSVNYVRGVVNKAGMRQGQSRTPVAIDCSRVYTSDFTAASGLRDMAKWALNTCESNLYECNL